MIIPKREYEKPDSGLYNSILADIVDLGLVTTTFKGETKTVPKVRFVWITEKKGKDGKPLQVWEQFNVNSWHEKANIYKRLKQVLNAPPDPKVDIDTYIGSVRKLLINRETTADTDYANIMGVLPADPGVVIDTGGYVMVRNRPKTQAGPNGAPVQTYASPQATQQAPTDPNAALIAQLQAQLAKATAAGTPAQGPDVAF